MCSYKTDKSVSTSLIMKKEKREKGNKKEKGEKGEKNRGIAWRGAIQEQQRKEI